MCMKQFYSHNNSSKTYEVYANTLGYLNMAFTVLFSIECALKILAFGPRVYLSVLYSYTLPSTQTRLCLDLVVPCRLLLE